MNRRRITLTLTAAALTLLGAVAWIAPAGAASGLDPIAVAQAQLANCQLLAAHSTSSAQRTRAQQCVTDQQRILQLLVPATPSPTAVPTTTPPVTTPPPTTVPPTTVPPTTPPAQTTNCLPVPSACGFPDATNTGVPAGWSPIQTVNGDMSVTTAGATLDGWDIHGCLDISAPNVTIRNSRVGCAVWSINARGTGLLLDHVTVSCGGTAGKGVVGVTFTAVALDVSGCEDGFYIDPAGATIRDSYVHDLFHASGAHTDSVQVVAGGQVVVDHNTLENPDPQGSSVISADTTDVRDVIVRGNLLAGGGYSMRCPDQGHGTNVQVVSWGKRVQTYDSSGNLTVTEIPCGGSTPETCNNIYNKSYNGYLPDSVWGGAKMPTRMSTMALLVLTTPGRSV